MSSVSWFERTEEHLGHQKFKHHAVVEAVFRDPTGLWIAVSRHQVSFASPYGSLNWPRSKDTNMEDVIIALLNTTQWNGLTRKYCIGIENVLTAQQKHRNKTE